MSPKITNAGLLEVYKIIVELYAKGLVQKLELKELISSLDYLQNKLPEEQEKHLH